MKKKIISILLILITSLFFCSFSKNRNIKVTGYIHSAGNVPFNYPVLYGDNEYKYKMYYDNEESKEILLSLQGNHIQVKGIVVKDNLEEYIIYPEEWKILKD